MKMNIMSSYKLEIIQLNYEVMLRMFRMLYIRHIYIWIMSFFIYIIYLLSYLY